eukprot:Pgem_evm1s9368
MLDNVEGPNRMRKRLCPNENFCNGDSFWKVKNNSLINEDNDNDNDNNNNDNNNDNDRINNDNDNDHINNTRCDSSKNENMDGDAEVPVKKVVGKKLLEKNDSLC